MINVIVACDRNNLIGKKGKLPWEIREDWDYFLETTRDGVLIMGRLCYYEFEKHAKECSVIALSRDPDITFPYARKANSLAKSLSIAKKLNKTAWICGGQAIYEEALPLADYLYLTEINAEFTGDVYLPPWEKYFIREISRKTVFAESFELTFRILSK
jgi:dihydrofolate reductase